MLNIKQLTNQGFRIIAAASLFVALAGLLISPVPASADTGCDRRAGVVQCGTATVEVFDAQTGARVYGAKVVAWNGAGLTEALYEIGEGVYTAQLPQGEWKIY